MERNKKKYEQEYILRKERARAWHRASITEKEIINWIGKRDLSIKRNKPIKKAMA